MRSDPSPPLYGIPFEAPIVPLESRFVGSSLDWTLTIPCAIDPAVDFIQSASLTVAPSGTGELVIANLTISGDEMTWTASGGQPGRLYTFKALVTMTNDRVFEFGMAQLTTRLLVTDAAQPIPSAGFGAPIVWTYLPSMDFTNLRNSAYLACIAGF